MDKSRANIETPAFNDECALNKTPVVGYVTVPMFIVGYDIECIVDAAFSGDSQSWIDSLKVLHDVPDTTCMAEKVARGGAILVMVDAFLEEHNDKPVPYVLTSAQVVSGLQQYAMNFRWSFDLENIDANIADIILQYALFNEQIFG
jgi:hypothetical protein